MESFEIHITIPQSSFAQAKNLGLKTISLELLDDNGKIIRVEHMTSDIRKYNNFAECLNCVTYLAKNLDGVERVKIEAPSYLTHYLNQAIYLETHFKSEVGQKNTSRNIGKNKIIGTKREVNSDNYLKFIEDNKDEEIELCLYDTRPEQDNDWIN